MRTVTGVNALNWPRNSFKRRLLQTNQAISMTRLAAFILRHRVGIITTILLLVLDQAAKLAVVRVIQEAGSKEQLHVGAKRPRVRITLTRNVQNAHYRKDQVSTEK